MRPMHWSAAIPCILVVVILATIISCNDEKSDEVDTSGIVWSEGTAGVKDIIVSKLTATDIKDDEYIYFFDESATPPKPVEAIDMMYDFSLDPDVEHHNFVIDGEKYRVEIDEADLMLMTNEEVDRLMTFCCAFSGAHSAFMPPRFWDPLILKTFPQRYVKRK